MRGVVINTESTKFDRDLYDLKKYTYETSSLIGVISVGDLSLVVS